VVDIVQCGKLALPVDNPVDNSVFGGSYEQGNICFNTDETLYWSRLKQLIDSGGLIFTLPDKVLVDEQG